MITVRLFNGQVLTFPDGTAESVIRAAAERATQSQATKPKVDLSSLRGNGTSGESGIGGPQLRQDAELNIKLKQKTDDDDNQLPERSPEYWRSVTGSSSSKARQLELQRIEAAGPEAMARIGFQDKETYYLNPSTDERVLKRSKVGHLPSQLDPGYRPKSATDRLHDAYEMEGRPVPTGDEMEARSELVRGVPARVTGSMSGLVLPLQAAEAVGRGLKEETKNLITGDYIGRPTGEGLHRGVRQGWEESPITADVGAVNRDVVEPARERYIDAATRAGMSPEQIAASDTGQMVAGEALNPGNYVGLEMLRTGAQMARTTPAALARRAAQESVGGARSLDEAGLVTREYGRGSAPSEIAQGKAARSGEFLPGAREPLLYRDPSGYGGVQWKGVVPDAIRKAGNEPWRTYRNSEMTGRLPLDRPASPGPRPRSVEGRQPIDIPITGGSPEDQARIGGLWDYASRRYPLVSRQVREVQIGPETYYEPETGILALAPDSHLGAVMHELTHAGQKARGWFNRSEWPTAEAMEPFAVRADDVYSRIPQPQSRPISTTAVVGNVANVESGTFPRAYGGSDISERFATFLKSNGIDDPERYYDLPSTQRTLLDRQFAANDAGPDTVAWSAYLLEHNMRPDDYTRLPLPERAKLETEFKMQVAQRADIPDPDANLPDYFYDPEARGWRVGNDPDSPIYEKQWQAKEAREGFRAYADSRDGGGGGGGGSWLGRLFGGRSKQQTAQTTAQVQAPGTVSTIPLESPRIALTPQARTAPAETLAEFRLKLENSARAKRQLSPEDLPFELRDLPLTRWSDADPSRRMRGTNPAHWDSERAGGHWTLGDDTAAHARGKGRFVVTESFTPDNPLILPNHQTGFDYLKDSGWKPSERQNAIYAKMHKEGGPWEDRYLNDFARSQGHDSIIILDPSQDMIEVIKLQEGIVGAPRTSPYLESFAGWSDELGGPAVLDNYMRRVVAKAGVGVDDIDDVTDPGDLLRLADDVEQRTGERLAADMLRERAGPLSRAADGRPFRVYADQPNGQNSIPASIAPVLPEEHAARAMGWALPPGSPIAVGPPIQLPEFQTNIAAQLGGDEALTTWVIQQSDAIYKEIGPPQTWDTLEEMAVRSGKTKEDLPANSSHWQVMSPELRLRLLYIAKDNESKIQSLQAKLVKGEATDIDKVDILRRIDSRSDFIKLGAKTGSAYGRALNSLKMEARLSLGDDQLLRQQLYRQYSKQLDAEKPLMDALAHLDPNNPEELQAFLRAVDKPTFREYVQEYWVSSILSGPASHERNLIGNTVNMLMENTVVRPLAAGFDAARVAGTGVERAIYLRETSQAAVGVVRGIRKGVERGWEVIKRGYDPETMKGKLFPVRSAFARSQNPIVRDIVGPVVTMPLRLLAASDALFKTMNWSAEIYAQAARMASKAGLHGDDFAKEMAHLVSNPTDEMVDAADNFALKATFNDEVSAFGKSIMNMRDLPGVAEPKSAIGRAGLETYRSLAGFVLPFIKIADRLMVRGFEYSPVGTLRSVAARQTGNFVESADLAARSAIGSVVMAYAASLAMEGRLTAGAPTDEAEKAAFFGAGKQAWSVRTDDGIWIPYGGLQPVGTPFALTASFWKGWTENGESPTDERIAWGAQQVGAYVTDQSYMDGLSKLIEAVSGGKGQAGRAGADLLTNTAWGFAPYSGLTRSVARGIDPRVIDADRIADRLWQNVPGVSLGMDARLTPWGEEVVPVGGRLRSGLAPGSILLPSREKSDPLDKELDRLGMPLGYVGKTLSDKLGKGKSHGRWKLAPDEYHYYQQTAGRTTRKLLERLYAKEGYPLWDIEKQREETEAAIGKAREYARIQTVRRHRGLGHQ